MREYYYRNREKFREYRKTRRAENAAYQKAYYAQVPKEVKAAWWTLGKAVQRGKIIRPDRCQKCGTVGPVEGHHYKGYAKEHQLTVEWLCKPCHGVEQRGREWRSRDEVVARKHVYQPGERPHKLTVRELDVARLAVQGYSMKDSGEMLGLSWRTVNFHLERVYRKLNVRSREELQKESGPTLGR